MSDSRQNKSGNSHHWNLQYPTLPRNAALGSSVVPAPQMPMSTGGLPGSPTGPLPPFRSTPAHPDHLARQDVINRARRARPPSPPSPSPTPARPERKRSARRATPCDFPEAAGSAAAPPPPSMQPMPHPHLQLQTHQYPNQLLYHHGGPGDARGGQSQPRGASKLAVNYLLNDAPQGGQPQSQQSHTLQHGIGQLQFPHAPAQVRTPAQQYPGAADFGASVVSHGHHLNPHGQQQHGGAGNQKGALVLSHSRHHHHQPRSTHHGHYAGSLGSEGALTTPGEPVRTQPGGGRGRGQGTRSKGDKTERLFACPTCGREFTERGNLNKHISSVHENVRSHVCTYEGCGSSFSFRDGLLRHEATVHRSERPYVCEICHRSFKQLSHLNKHMRTVHR